MSELYHVRQFARLSGVTVRALHHYDRLGLLKPRRTQVGYRLYSLADLERLERIVALEFLGISLKQIKTLLRQDPRELSLALQRHRRALEEKRRFLDCAINAIREAEQSIRPGKDPDSALLTKIIKEIDMQNSTDWMKKYSSEETWAKIQERGRMWTPERQEAWSKQWSAIFHDAENILGEDPSGPKAQALAARAWTLVEGFTGGDPSIAASVRNLYADSANWPGHFKEQMAPFSNREVWAFLNKAMALTKK